MPQGRWRYFLFFLPRGVSFATSWRGAGGGQERQKNKSARHFLCEAAFLQKPLCETAFVRQMFLRACISAKYLFENTSMQKPSVKQHLCRPIYVSNRMSAKTLLWNSMCAGTCLLTAFAKTLCQTKVWWNCSCAKILLESAFVFENTIVHNNICVKLRLCSKYLLENALVQKTCVKQYLCRTTFRPARPPARRLGFGLGLI